MMGETNGMGRPTGMGAARGDCVAVKDRNHLDSTARMAIGAVLFIMGLTGREALTMILDGDFPATDGNRYSMRSVDEWLARHEPTCGFRYTPAPRPAFHQRRPMEHEGPTCYYSYLLWLRRMQEMQLDGIEPDVGYVGDGVPRDLSGRPFEPLDWRRLGQ